MSDDSPMGERVATLESWAKGHEERCADRQEAMGREIGRLTKGAWGLLIAIAGWALVQVYGYAKAPAAGPPAAIYEARAAR